MGIFKDTAALSGVLRFLTVTSCGKAGTTQLVFQSADDMLKTSQMRNGDRRSERHQLSGKQGVTGTGRRLGLADSTFHPIPGPLGTLAVAMPGGGVRKAPNLDFKRSEAPRAVQEGKMDLHCGAFQARSPVLLRGALKTVRREISFYPGPDFHGAMNLGCPRAPFNQTTKNNMFQRASCRK